MRTLPPGFYPLGAVSGHLGTNPDGHLIAVIATPAGAVHLSSNDKPMVEVSPRTMAVPGPDPTYLYDVDALHQAVFEEFKKVYQVDTPVPENKAGFTFGVSGAPDGFATVPPKDRDPIVDRILFDCDMDETVRLPANARGRSVPDLDWSRLRPWQVGTVPKKP